MKAEALAQKPGRQWCAAAGQSTRSDLDRVASCLLLKVRRLSWQYHGQQFQYRSNEAPIIATNHARDQAERKFRPLQPEKSSCWQSQARGEKGQRLQDNLATHTFYGCALRFLIRPEKVLFVTRNESLPRIDHSGFVSIGFKDQILRTGPRWLHQILLFSRVAKASTSLGLARFLVNFP